MRPIIVIPSRLASTRLPRKALADIHGQPMIVHVVAQAVKAKLGPVVVAAGDEEIIEVVQGMEGVRAVLTDPAFPSGTDRIQAALEECDPEQKHDVVINLQGDLPLITPDIVRKVLIPLQDEAVDIGTLVAPVIENEERDTPSVVKAVCAFMRGSHVARALYFSRSVVPWGEGPYWHHIGIYAWRRKALARFVQLAPSPLEKREKLEQLRALESGMVIGCTSVFHAPVGVDVQADLEKVRAFFPCR